MFKFVSGKVVFDPLAPAMSRLNPELEGPFAEAGKPVDGKTPHHSPRPPRQENSREAAEPELRPA